MSAHIQAMSPLYCRQLEIFERTCTYRFFIPLYDVYCKFLQTQRLLNECTREVIGVYQFQSASFLSVRHLISS